MAFEIQAGLFYCQPTIHQGKLPLLQTAERPAQGQAEHKDCTPVGHTAEILHPKASPALKTLLIITQSVLLPWQEGEAREATGRTEQVVKRSYEQTRGKDAWNTEKSRGNVMVTVPDLAKWQGEKGSRSSDKAVCQLSSLLIHHVVFTKS